MGFEEVLKHFEGVPEGLYISEGLRGIFRGPKDASGGT